MFAFLLCKRKTGGFVHRLTEDNLGVALHCELNLGEPKHTHWNERDRLGLTNQDNRVTSVCAKITLTLIQEVEQENANLFTANLTDKTTQLRPTGKRTNIRKLSQKLRA